MVSNLDLMLSGYNGGCFDFYSSSGRFARKWEVCTFYWPANHLFQFDFALSQFEIRGRSLGFSRMGI